MTPADGRSIGESKPIFSCIQMHRQHRMINYSKHSRIISWFTSVDLISMLFAWVSGPKSANLIKLWPNRSWTFVPSYLHGIRVETIQHDRYCCVQFFFRSSVIPLNVKEWIELFPNPFRTPTFGKRLEKHCHIDIEKIQKKCFWLPLLRLSCPKRG